MGMTVGEKRQACACFLWELAERLGDDYELVPSCNKDYSMYLVPKGTIDELSYYGKPILSFRCSNHWNWFSNTKKCGDRFHIQCNSVDLPYPRWRRSDSDRATEPILGFQVALYGKDKVYHHVFGDRYDRKTRKWTWKIRSVQQVVDMLAEL